MTLFRKRWGLRVFRKHGESGDYDDKAMAINLSSMRKKIADFDAKDVFNADEFSLFYHMAPDTAIATSSTPGRKNLKSGSPFWLAQIQMARKNTS